MSVAAGAGDEDGDDVSITCHLVLLRPGGLLHKQTHPHTCCTASQQGNSTQLQFIRHTAVYVKLCTRVKFGDYGFHYGGPAAWNSLPGKLHHITNTDLFKSCLKTELFSRTY